jgi:hypothetical protein
LSNLLKVDRGWGHVHTPGSELWLLWELLPPGREEKDIPYHVSSGEVQ